MSESVSNPEPQSDEVRHKSSKRALEIDRADGNLLDMLDQDFFEKAALGREVQPSIESIIDGDQRERIADTRQAPWRSICAIRSFDGGRFRLHGTGWLAGPNTVITAGHVLFHRSLFRARGNNGWASAVEVSPGRNGQELPFQKYVIRGANRFKVLRRWHDSTTIPPEAEFDLGCIYIDRPVGSEIGYFSFGVVSPDDLDDYSINISGYPSSHGGMLQLHHRDSILYANDSRIFYRTDTTGGQSGAPAWIVESSGSQPLVVGTHAYDHTRTPPELGIRANSATKINATTFAQIKRWVGVQHSA